MKKLFCILLALLLCFLAACGQDVAPTSSAAVIASSSSVPTGNIIAFPDFWFENEVRKLIGKINGEPIFESDVSVIKELVVRESAITDLTGIEYFTSLEYLNCSETNITELELSNNTMLTKLVCSNTYIETGDSLSDSIPYYVARWINTISSLKLSNNQKLELLDCSGNAITELDLSQNPALKILSCGGTGITTLDLSNNPALESLRAF